MPKKVKVEMKPLQYTGVCSGKYMDEHGQHPIKPGADPVEFTPKMYEFHLAEPVWEIPEMPKIRDGE